VAEEAGRWEPEEPHTPALTLEAADKYEWEDDQHI